MISKNLKVILTAGFAMFAMFFGSGNLVFPLRIGIASVSQYDMAALGLMLTGVLVPFLGLAAMIKFHGDRHAFFAPLSKPIAFALTFFMLALMGPFGVLPRCILVTYGGIKLLVDAISFPVFSGLFLLLIGFLTWKRSKTVDIIGQLLTPWLLVGLIVVIASAVIFGPNVPQSNLKNCSDIFKLGLLEGYQTMDLMASFFFSATTVAYIAAVTKNQTDSKRVGILSLKACGIGASLLMLIYLGLVYLGAIHGDLLSTVPSEFLLAKAAEFTLGSLAIPIVAGVIFLACLTTAVILATLFADFLYEDVAHKRVPRSVTLVTTLAISFAFSLMGFENLAHWIGVILTYAYPALIGYTVVGLVDRKTFHIFGPAVFWVILFATVMMKFAPVAF